MVLPYLARKASDQNHVPVRLMSDTFDLGTPIGHNFVFPRSHGAGLSVYDEASNVIDATCACRSRGILRLRKPESRSQEERSS